MVTVVGRGKERRISYNGIALRPLLVLVCVLRAAGTFSAPFACPLQQAHWNKLQLAHCHFLDGK